ncbi:lactonase family protein [Spirochaeta dissipatitropha]
MTQRFYAAGYSGGIRLLELRESETRDHSLRELYRFDPCSQPGYLLYDSTRKLMVVANEDAEDSRLMLFDVTDQQKPVELANIACQGRGPCHITMSGDSLWLSHYVSGSVEIFHISDRGLQQTGYFQNSGQGRFPDRQEGPHIHSCIFSPCGRFSIAADLGTDELLVFSTETHDLVQRFGCPPGSGPRSMCWAAGMLAVSFELGNAFGLFSWEDDRIRQLVYSAESGNTDNKSIQNFPSDIGFQYGRLYVGNRGCNCISVFRMEENEAVREKDIPSHSTYPRQIIILSDNSLLVANQGGGQISFVSGDSSALLDLPDAVSITGPLNV